MRKCFHWLGRRLPSGELVRYVRPFTEKEFERLANIGVSQGFVVWHIDAADIGTRRSSILMGRRVARSGLIPVDPICALKNHDPARYRLM